MSLLSASLSISVPLFCVDVTTSCGEFAPVVCVYLFVSQSGEEKPDGPSVLPLPRKASCVNKDSDLGERQRETEAGVTETLRDSRRETMKGWETEIRGEEHDC